MSSTASADDAAQLFYGILKSVEEFNQIEIRPVVQGQLALKPREECFVATYYRCVMNVATILALPDTSHFQAISMAARAVFELAVDIRLLSLVADSADKSLAFSKLERLKAAQKIVAFVTANPQTKPHDLKVIESFVKNEGPSILASRAKLWPTHKGRLDHWSGTNLLSDRAKMLGTPFDRIYSLEYPRLSWSAHPGMAGVIGLKKEVFTAMAAAGLKIAVDCYGEVLKTVGTEMKIDKAIPRLEEKLQLATHLPLTSGPEEAQKLAAELLS